MWDGLCPSHFTVYRTLEGAVIEGCKRSEKRAVKKFYDSSAGWMLAVGIRYISDRNEALSVVHLALMAALESIHGFDTSRDASIEAWLKTILIRKLIDYNRKVEKDIGEERPAMELKYSVNEGEESARKSDLIKLINTLPKQSKSVFNLFAIEGYSHKEIAGIMGISEGTSKWHLNNARSNLQRSLKKQEEHRII